MYKKNFFILATVIILLAVIIGAYGAHGLRPFMGETGMTTFKTGSQYHFYHGIAIWLVLSLHFQINIQRISRIIYFFTAGIICFSGSLYLLSIKSILSSSLVSILGPITPIGGLFFIVGWVLILISLIKSPSA